MQDKVKQYIEEKQMLAAKDTVIVGVSGGADSVCILALLNLWKREFALELIAVHVHHGLREEGANQDEQYVRALCGDLEIPLLVYHENIRQESERRKCSLEEAGREVRHEIFRDVQKKYQGSKIALAHHKNDNAETLLMNLARGTGIRGLKGIVPVNGDIIRPLLCVERLEIETYLKEQKICYQIDETNNENIYMRNRIRNNLIPYMQENVNAKTVEHMHIVSEQLQEIQEYLQQEVNVYFDKSVYCEENAFVIQAEHFTQVPKALRSFVIQQALEQVSGKRKNIGMAHIKEIENLLSKQVGRKIDLAYGVQAVRCYEGVRLMKTKDEIKVALRVNLFDNEEVKIEDVLVSHRIFQKNAQEQAYENSRQNARQETCTKTIEQGYVKQGYTKQFDYDIIKGDVIVRTRESGDYIVINEQGNTQKLKDYFINEKIPSEKRDTIWLIADGQHILWIVGYRSSYACKVSEQTKRILEIKIQTDVEDTDERQY